MTLQRVRVLIAEDTFHYREHADGLTRSWGMEPVLAVNGLEAVRLTRETPIDVCLMDIQMPRMNGFQASQQIRSEGKKSFPIIALTALEPSVKAECIKFGMDDYLQKPYRDQDLKSILTEWLLYYQNYNSQIKKVS